jgi:sugar phosphate isomerase/epimerase
MKKQPSRIQVPFGFETDNQQQGPHGNMWAYGSFTSFSLEQLQRIVELAQRMEMKKLVLYPLHEETLRRVGEVAEPFYRRVDRLQELLEQMEIKVDTVIERWEGRRKKYTPMDTSFRFLAEKYRGPYFVYVTLDMANKLAAFNDFEMWIKKLRLCVDMKFSTSSTLHPRLQNTTHRWDAVT